MRITWRGAELGLLVPILLLVPLGFIVTNIALSGTFEPGPLELALGYVALFVGAHLVLVAFGHRGDQLILPAVGAMGAIGIVMLNRLPQDLAGTAGFGVELGMAATQLLWFAVGIVGDARHRHRPARRRDPAALQVLVGGDRHRAARRHAALRLRGERRAAVDRPRPGERAAGRVPEDRARHLHRRLPGGDADAPDQRPDADRLPLHPAAAVLPADARAVRRGHAHGRPAQRPRDRAALLRHLPDDAVRGDRAALVRAHRPHPVRGRGVRRVPAVRPRPAARQRLARPVRRSAGRRVPAGARDLRVRPRRHLRRGARAGAGHPRRRADDPVRPHRLHLHRHRRGARAARGVRAARLRRGVRLPRPADRGARPGRLRRRCWRWG